MVLEAMVVTVPHLRADFSDEASSGLLEKPPASGRLVPPASSFNRIAA
jgi:hypothetical protein